MESGVFAVGEPVADEYCRTMTKTGDDVAARRILTVSFAPRLGDRLVTAPAATLTAMTEASLDFRDLSALFINTTLTRSPGQPHAATD
jgi:hypothetical protein